jgi:CHAT domain-containing protein
MTGISTGLKNQHGNQRGNLFVMRAIGLGLGISAWGIAMAASGAPSLEPSAAALSGPNSGPDSGLDSGPIPAPKSGLIGDRPTGNWVQGVKQYEAGQPALALQTWQAALAQEPQPQQQALIYGYLSLAYQQLGRWEEAQGAIALAQSRLGQPGVIAPDIQARVLNAQGRLYWSRGKAEAALVSWQKAEANYRQGGDEQGRQLAVLNSIQALRATGFGTMAEARLMQLYQEVAGPTTNPTANPTAQAMSQSKGLNPQVVRTLGEVLLQVGKLQLARQVLQSGLPNSGLARAKTLLDLGNVERSIYQRAKSLGKPGEAKVAVAAALKNYREAETLASPTANPAAQGSRLIEVQARLNQLALLVTVDPPQAQAIAQTLQSQVSALSLNREVVQAKLNLVHSLTQMGQDPTALTQAALTDARALQDPILESYALGQQGAWYEKQGQWAKAQDLTEQALRSIDPTQIAAVRYRWEWQLGRLLKQRGDQAGAIASYNAAVESLKSVRSDLLSMSPELQFSFRDDVEPVYRELVGLLLDVPAGQEPSQTVLKQAIQQVDSLQLAELENFLGCKLAQVVDLGAVTVDPTAAKIYPLILDDRLAVVVEPPGKGPLQYHEVRRSRSEVQGILRQLREDLATQGRTPEAIEGLQTVHQWLIEPFAEQLAQGDQPVKTLVFVLDGELRNVPMAALYDGENYLISRYAVALSPRLQLFDPRPRSAKLSLLLGGMGQPQNLGDRNFPEIVNLAPELDGILKLFPSQPPLVNEAFTKLNLAKSLGSQAFSAVHLKTHGVFSSDPDETFVVTYQNLLTGKELGQLLQGRGDRTGTPSPIELLILSACSTAQGDNRAVLGMAGLAVQAGAQSVVSTLWEAQDVPNTALMLKFYEELKKPEVSRAQALRSAQLSLLAEGYTTPNVWATYVLVGNWL